MHYCGIIFAETSFDSEYVAWRNFSALCKTREMVSPNEFLEFVLR